MGEATRDKMVRKEIWLTKEASWRLQQKANAEARSVKKFMELALEDLAFDRLLKLNRK